MPTLKVHWNRVQGDAWAEFFAVNLDDPHFDNLEGVYVVWLGGSQPAAIATGQGPIRDTLKALKADPAVAQYKNGTMFVTWAKVEKVARPGVTRYLLDALKPRVPAAPPSAAMIEVNLPGRGDEAPPDVAAPPPGQIYVDMLAEGAGSLDEDPGVAAAKEAEAKAREEAKARAEAQAKAEAAARAKAQADAEAAAKAARDAARAAELAKQDAAARAEAEAADRAAAAARAAAAQNLPLQPLFAKLVADAKQAPKPAGLFGGGAKPTPSEEKLVGDVVYLILKEAMRMRASDIHLEPQEPHLRVRFRIDGILEEVLQVPHNLNLRVVSNIRVSCSLDPEKLSGGKPEDGRMTVKIEGKEADLRLSTFPTPHGDKAVLRVIPRANRIVTLDELGLDKPSVELLKTLLFRPQGLIIVTGPTGSGKSTTLYASLYALNDMTRNIVTLEDPIERKIPGISQGLIQPKQGFGFAEGLRSILRQDPNIIMVGEIRDQETAEIALSAALTGHLLLTTLHTVSAIGAVNRLIDMGLEPFLVASALTAVTAQRLARTICPVCIEPYQATSEQAAEVETRAKKVGVTVPKDLFASLKHGAGCAECRGTGYRGRVLIFEAVIATPPLREAILRKASVDDLRVAAMKGGMQPLLLDGLRKAADGRTTLDEILRVIDVAD